MAKLFAGDMTFQSLQSSSEFSQLPLPEGFSTKRGPEEKIILVTNVGILEWVVKQQIVENQHFFVILVLKIQNYVLNHV